MCAAEVCVCYKNNIFPHLRLTLTPPPPPPPPLGLPQISLTCGKILHHC